MASDHEKACTSETSRLSLWHAMLVARVEYRVRSESHV